MNKPLLTYEKRPSPYRRQPLVVMYFLPIKLCRLVSLKTLVTAPTISIRRSGAFAVVTCPKRYECFSNFDRNHCSESTGNIAPNQPNRCTVRTEPFKVIVRTVAPCGLNRSKPLQHSFVYPCHCLLILILEQQVVLSALINHRKLHEILNHVNLPPVQCLLQ